MKSDPARAGRGAARRHLRLLQHYYEGATTTCEAAFKSISDNDVRQVRRSDYQQSTCTQSQPQTAVVGEDNCLDADGDGIAACDGDCDDYYYDVSNTCGGGGVCEYTWDEVQDCMNMETWRWDPETCECFCDDGFGCFTPILVDVVGDGFRLTDARGGVEFDLQPGGAKERLSWTAPGSDDAWLALDRNGNGVIDSGREMFGNAAPQPAPPAGRQKNGFNALAVYDSPARGGNDDGVIDERDSVFPSLLLWQDASHDGVSQPGELHALPELGVVSASLDYREAGRRDRYGNLFRYQAAVSGAGGRTARRLAYDVFLAPGP